MAEYVGRVVGLREFVHPIPKYLLQLSVCAVLVLQPLNVLVCHDAVCCKDRTFLLSQSDLKPLINMAQSWFDYILVRRIEASLASCTMTI